MKTKYLLMAASGFLFLGADYHPVSKNHDLTEKNNYVISIKTAKQLENLIHHHPRVAVDISATYCGACRFYDPIFNSIAKKYQSKVIFSRIISDKIDKKEDDKITKKYQIDFLPTTLFFRKKIKVKQINHKISKRKLDRMVRKYLLK